MRSVILALFVGLLLMGAAVSAHAQLQVTYSSVGVNTLTYNGVTLADTATHPEDAFTVGRITHVRPDQTTFSEDGWGTATRSMNTSTKEMTWSFSWGSVRCLHAVVGSQLNLTISITNSDSVNSLAGCNVMPFYVRFPTQPTGWDPGIPEISFNINGPTIIDADYGSGQLVFCNDDAAHELYSGLFSLADTPTTHRYFLYASAIPFPGQPAFWTILNRVIPPGGSDKYTLSVRFAASGTSLTNIAADVLAAYRVAYPVELIWPDRRSIATLHLAEPALGWPKNLRGWFEDQSIDVTTPVGVEIFHQKLLAYADNAISIMKSMDSQGGIVWDLEGEQYPHATSYIGDPRILAQLCPEMDSIADAFFQKFKDAGFKIGCCVRPQQLVITATNAYQDLSADAESELISKVDYAKNRWGLTMFYIDSNGSTDSAIDARIIRRLLERWPDTLFVPEHENTLYYSASAPFGEIDMGDMEVNPPLALLQYPQAFWCLYIPPDKQPNMDVNALTPQLTTVVRRGDILLSRGWYNDVVYNTIITNVYHLAGDIIPPTIIVTNPVEGAVLRGVVNFEAFAWDNTGKPAGVRFRVDGANYGAEDTNYPYATSLNTTQLSGGSHTLDAVARDMTGLYNTSTVVHVTVDNTSPAPWVSISAGSNASEPSTPGSFTVTRAGSAVSAITVGFTVSGTATEGTDYQAIGTTVNMAAGVTSVPITITPIDDTLPEGTETITVTLRSGTGYGVTTTNTATINLLDNEVLVIPPGLVGWWRLDETGGGTASDSTGNGNTGTLYGGSWYPTGGRVNGALGFYGQQYANCGAGASLNTASATVAFWMKPSSVAQMVPVGKIPNGSGAGYVIKLRQDGAVWFRVGAEGGTAMDVYGGPYTNNAWTHVAATFDNGTKKLALYLNGVLSGQQPTLDTTLNAASTPFMLSSTTEPYSGMLDDVRVYNYALSQSEIQVLVTNVTTNVSQTATVTVSAGANASEPSTPGSFTIYRSGNTAAISVNIAMSGTATAGTDYQTVSTPVYFASGVMSVSITITPIDDLLMEGTETITLTIQSGTGYSVGAQRSATINLLDNDSTTASQPVGWWKLDESSGTNAADSSGNGNTGRLSGGTWQPTGGHIAGAIHLNAGNVVNCGTGASLNTPSVTVAFWMKPDAVASVIPLDKLPNTGAVGYAVKLRDTGSIWFRVGAEAGAAIDVYGANGIYSSGVWTHVACTFDSQTGAMKMYVNGVLENHQPTYTVSLNASNTAFRLGSVAEQYAGLLDDVRVYDVVLSASDIQAVMNSTSDTGSVFRFSNTLFRGGANKCLYWLSVTGETYAIYKSTNLTKAWGTIPLTNNIQGDGTIKVYTDSAPGRAAFYRMGVTTP